MTEVRNILKRLPVGIQTFSEIIEGGYLYVDKTDLVYSLTQLSKYIFLSRPRRFGKTLLTSTLESYFQGRKDLFRGLAIENLEKDWTEYPVLRFDMSSVRSSNPATLRENIAFMLETVERRFSLESKGQLSLSSRLGNIIALLHEKFGKKVVIIVDEYDAPLLDLLHSEKEPEVREILKEFYSPLKWAFESVRFVFITGITKFSQLSIFSTLNNLTDISMMEEYASLCGFTEEELRTGFDGHIRRMADKTGRTAEDVRALLKQRYDGYHFSGKSPDIYNPFSILKVLDTADFADYWFESGTPTFLIGQMRRFGTDILSLEGTSVDRSAFSQPTEAMQTALPLLYQSGYLTIKDFNPDSERYLLAIPNAEVRTGLTKNLIPYVTGKDDVQVTGVKDSFVSMWRAGEYDKALMEIKVFLAGVPYPEFGRMLRKESFYETLMYVIFASSANTRLASTQVKTARGKVDMVLSLPESVTAFEFKVDGSAEEALEQIDSRDYLLPYAAGGKKLIKCGVNFSGESRTIEDWKLSVGNCSPEQGSCRGATEG